MEQGRHRLRAAGALKARALSGGPRAARAAALRSALWQALAVALVVAAVAWLAHNTLANMRLRGIQGGFDFLLDPAGFDIGEKLFGYEPVDAYWRAFAVGIANTLRVAVLGIVCATVLGTAIGLARLAPHALLRGLAGAYVEVFRNVPLLLQLLLVYLLLTEALPDADAPAVLGAAVFVSKGGLAFPLPAGGHAGWVIGALAGALAAWAWRRHARSRFDATGVPRPVVLPGVALVVAGGTVGWAAARAAGWPAPAWQLPALGDFGVAGGGTATPEFAAVLLGLTLYTAAFIAEVVRAGVQSVPRGQVEAAGALGLSRAQQTRLVVLPQALRLIVPPLTNQVLNLTKNSSLAVAIGYPDVVSIANTAINQTGRAVECIAVVMAVYLCTSLATAAAMNAWNRRAALRER